jgi:formate hydrogenlyase subunit 6/NADH:ubiquinone oxidoreductase subunit I
VKDKSTYWSDISLTASSVYTGLRLTLSHLLKARKSRIPVAIKDPNYFALQEGISTIQYPHETIPVPDHGRYQLHNEIDDCIVCDKCAKICPVDCIDIVPIKSAEEIGKTSDGTPKRIYAAKFDIDMAKCCFCGLCTTVCPTECLTMTKKYDFSVFDIRDHNFVFGDMTEAQIKEKKENWEEHQRNKTAAATPPVVTATENNTESIEAAPAVPGAKPVFRPRVMKPAAPPTTETPKEEAKEITEEKEETASLTPPPATPPKPVFRPKIMKPVVPPPSVPDSKQEDKVEEKEATPPAPAPAVRPVFRPKIKPPGQNPPPES